MWQKYLSDSSFFRFVIVGGIAFGVDAGVLTLLVKGTDVGLYLARVVSFSLAVSVAWYLHRLWTFDTTSQARRGREYSAYIITQVIGALINLAVYVVCIERYQWMAQHPVLPLAIGSVAALIFNFVCAKKLVFIKR